MHDPSLCDTPDDMSHFIAMIMVNVSHVLCCSIDWLLQQVFPKTLVLSVEGQHQANRTYPNIDKRTWLTLTIIIIMK